jgi:hypothetical protein
MSETQIGIEAELSPEMVSLENLELLTGFPKAMIKKELLLEDSADEVSMEDFRKVMLSFIDKTMLE